MIFLYVQRLYFKVTLYYISWRGGGWEGERGSYASSCCRWEPNLYKYSSPHAAVLTVPAVISITTAAIKPFIQIRESFTAEWSFSLVHQHQETITVTTDLAWQRYCWVLKWLLQSSRFTALCPANHYFFKLVSKYIKEMYFTTIFIEF